MGASCVDRTGSAENAPGRRGASATVIALLSLLPVLLGQLPFPILGRDKSEEASSTNHSESPKRARHEGTLEAVGFMPLLGCAAMS